MNNLYVTRPFIVEYLDLLVDVDFAFLQMIFHTEELLDRLI